MIPADTLHQIVERFEFLEAKMSGGVDPGQIAELAKEYSDLKPVVASINEYQTLQSDLTEAEAMLDDPEMRALAEDELPDLRARLPKLEQALRIALLPKDAADERSAIIEIRPGTGGDEAALFAGDLLSHVSEIRRSCTAGSSTLIELSESELGGYQGSHRR